MRVLFASTRGVGHLNPLVPLIEAARSRGHDVLVAAPPSLADTVADRGYPFWEFADPPEDELGVVWSTVPSLPADEANVVVIRDIFGRLDTTASLPRLLEACDEWRPDVVVRDPAEFGSAVAAELRGVPHARVAIGVASVEELSLEIAGDTVDGIARAAGLSADGVVDAVRRSPYLTSFPASLEDGSRPVPPATLRFRDPAWDERPDALPDWWDDGDAPLVYVTFGSVAGGLPFAPQLYGAAMEAVAAIPVRVLLTVGRGADIAAFPPAPPNVRVEPWVPQADVLAHATAAVCHGGSGSTLGSLAAGLPLVVVPLFADQPYNARQVEAVGAGLVAQPDPAAIRTAVERVLAEDRFAASARDLAAELRAHPSSDAAVETLERLADGL